MKKLMLGFLLGGIIFGSIVYAVSYNAKDISYKKDGQSTNVNDALNELYQNISNGNAYIFTHDTSNGTHSYTVEKKYEKWINIYK